jgi:glycosyltransferase involved in cell wall biosynthesis
MTESTAPRVSILTTVYNAAEFLPVVIECVHAQTFTDWELVLVDDGSTDGSRAQLADLADPRIRVTLLPQNVGRLHAIRHAFDLARGEYVAILDADDVARPDRLAKQVALLDARPEVLLVGSWARMIDEHGTSIGAFHPPVDEGQIRELLGWANPIVHSSATYRAAAARAVGGYPLSMRHSHDCALWTRLAARGSVAMIPEELCDQRVVASSMTRGPRFQADVVRDGMLLAREARELLPLRGRGVIRNRDALLVAEVKWALYQLRSGAPLAAAVSLARAVMRNPLGVFRSRSYRREYLR